MPAISKFIWVNPGGGKIEVDVFIGQAQFGKYGVYLYDANGKISSPRRSGGLTGGGWPLG
jgi:hypothetical protein